MPFLVKSVWVYYPCDVYETVYRKVDDIWDERVAAVKANGVTDYVIGNDLTRSDKLDDIVADAEFVVKAEIQPQPNKMIGGTHKEWYLGKMAREGLEVRNTMINVTKVYKGELHKLPNTDNLIMSSRSIVHFLPDDELVEQVEWLIKQ